MSRWRSRPAGTRRPCCPGSTATTWAARSTSCSPASTAWPSTPPSRRVRAELADADARPPPRRRARRPACWRSSGAAAAAARRSSTVTSHYRGDRYQLHISLDRTMPDEARHITTGGEPMTTADATAEAGAKRRLNLAPIQKFGRSLMLPIAALPVAALLLRLGQPDLLGADGLGWDKVAAVLGRRRRRAVREPAAAVRRRRRDRHGAEGRRLDGAGRGRRLPRLQGRRGRRVAVRARRSRRRARTRS